MQEREIARSRPGTNAPLNPMQGWTPCPRCLKRNRPGAEECRSCGVVIAKWKPERADDQDVAVGGSIELAQLWADAVAAWDREDAHLAFLFSCSTQDRLSFAARKYAQVLAANPSDARAQAMRGRVVKLASSPIDSKGARKTGIEFVAPRATLIAIVLSAIVFFAGALVPGLRNLAGVGASMLAVSIGLRVWRR